MIDHMSSSSMTSTTSSSELDSSDWHPLTADLEFNDQTGDVRDMANKAAFGTLAILDQPADEDGERLVDSNSLKSIVGANM